MAMIDEFHIARDVAQGDQTTEVRMRVLAAGKGEPLLLVHGYGGSAESWYFNTEALAAQYRVYAMDLPGFGLSTKVVLPGLADFAGWLETLLEHEGLESAHLVGHSMGGAIALEFARRNPAQLRSLALVAPVGLGPMGTPEFLERVLGARDAADLREFYALVVQDTGLITEAMLERTLAVRALPGAMDVLAQQGPKLAQWAAAYRERLTEITLPLWVVWGRNDRVIPAGNAEVAAGVSKAQVHFFEDCGHVPQLEYPEAFNRLLLGFLRGAELVEHDPRKSRWKVGKSGAAKIARCEGLC